MPVPKNDTYKDYARYAEHCLNIAAAATDQESRSIQREMAALAGPSKCKWDYSGRSVRRCAGLKKRIGMVDWSPKAKR
jgi:hypothetical protein